jgi:hypothetical protein
VTALIVGTVLALGALVYVLWPVIVAAERRPLLVPSVSPQTSADAGREPDAISVLREIEFDHATGKLSESDYAVLKSQYTSEAVAAIRARDVGDDPVEAEIRRIRSQTRVCPACGPRPEPAARYCSRCGAALA